MKDQPPLISFMTNQNFTKILQLWIGDLMRNGVYIHVLEFFLNELFQRFKLLPLTTMDDFKDRRYWGKTPTSKFYIPLTFSIIAYVSSPLSAVFKDWRLF